MKSLNISECRCLDESFPQILKDKTAELNTLNVSGLMTINDSNIAFFGDLKHLEDLNISRCCSITDSGLLNLSAKSLVFKRLNMSGLVNTTSHGINFIIKIVSAHLEELDISLLCQKTIDNSAISSLSKCSSLIYLNISGSNITDTSFLSNLSKLQSINFSSISSIDNDILLNLVRMKIKILRVSNCPNVNYNFLEVLYKLDKCSLLLLEINRILIPDQHLIWIDRCVEKHSPNLRIIRSTSMFWDPKNIGLKIPLMPIGFEKPFLKGMKKPIKKKENDKNPVAMLAKFELEYKPKTVLDTAK